MHRIPYPTESAYVELKSDRVYAPVPGREHGGRDDPQHRRAQRARVGASQLHLPVRGGREAAVRGRDYVMFFCSSR